MRQEPRLEATTLYEYLVEQHPGQYKQTLRTVQRRVQEWKALHGAPQEVMFELRHEPGGVGHSDFTEVKAALQQGWRLTQQVRFCANRDPEPAMASRRQHQQNTQRLEFTVRSFSYRPD